MYRKGYVLDQITEYVEKLMDEVESIIEKHKTVLISFSYLITREIKQRICFCNLENNSLLYKGIKKVSFIQGDRGNYKAGDIYFFLRIMIQIYLV